MSVKKTTPYTQHVIRIASWLAKYRQQTGWTERGLATSLKKCGHKICANSISNLERNRHPNSGSSHTRKPWGRTLNALLSIRDMPYTIRNDVLDLIDWEARVLEPTEIS